MTEPIRFPTLDVTPDRPGSARVVTVHSPGLGRRVDLSFWVPADADGPLPLVTLLHGVYGSHWGWIENGDAPGAAAALIADGSLPPVVLAMPSDGLWGHGSGYVAHADADYEQWIVDEVPAALAGVGVSLSGAGAIIGLSMGGYGALRLSMRHRDRYVAAVGLSSITRWQSMATFVGSLDAYPEVEDPDVGPLIADGADRPALRIDCGEDDLLIEENRALHSSLLAADVEHEYEEAPGGHSWDYWRARLPSALAFVGRELA